MNRDVLVAVAALAAATSCVAPESLRFYGGYWDVRQIDNTQCHARAANVRLEVPGGDVPPALILDATPGTPVVPPPGPPTASTYRVDAVGIGPFDVHIHARGSLDLDGVFVGADARIGIAVVPPALRPRPVPGFVFGVDLRPYRQVVFVVDNGADMCEFVDAANQRVVLDEVMDQVVAALAGLPLDREVSLVAASGVVRQLVPGPGDAGRRVAMEWTCGLLCEGDSSITLALVRAFAETPDVVILISNGAMPAPGQHGHVSVLPDLAPLAADPGPAVERMEATVPVIAIDVGRGVNRERLLRIARATGGSYVVP